MQSRSYRISISVDDFNKAEKLTKDQTVSFRGDGPSPTFLLLAGLLERGRTRPDLLIPVGKRREVNMRLNDALYRFLKAKAAKFDIPFHKLCQAIIAAELAK